MTRDECIARLEAYMTPGITDEQYGSTLWWMHKQFPHQDFASMFSRDWGRRPIAEIVDEALRIEAERAHEPVPPYITDELLLDNIAYLQHRIKTLGELNAHIMIQLDLEFPHAYLPEMIWKTHVDATPEEILAELHRRQEAAGDRTLPPRWLRGGDDPLSTGRLPEVHAGSSNGSPA